MALVAGWPARERAAVKLLRERLVAARRRGARETTVDAPLTTLPGLHTVCSCLPAGRSA